MDDRRRAWTNIDERANEIWKLALRIHQNPELSMHEVLASSWLCAALEEEGFQVRKGIPGLETAFSATHPCSETGAVVALLAEYDALPGLGHACGHNIIAGIAMGAALGLAPMKKHLSGSLKVIGTPAEEKGGGKIALLADGAFQDVDVALMIHPGHQTWSSRDYAAMSEVEVSFTGVAAHALSNPEDGVSALDPLVETFVSIAALRKRIDKRSRIHGIIVNGGEEPGVIPENSSARFIVSAHSNDYRSRLVAELEKCARKAARSVGARASIRTIGPEYMTMLLNYPLASRFEHYVEELGFPVEQPDDAMASTDMGNVSWVVPSLHPHIAITSERVTVHTAAFADEACKESARSAMIAGAKALAAICLDLWEESSYYEDVKSEFHLAKNRPTPPCESLVLRDTPQAEE